MLLLFLMFCTALYRLLFGASADGYSIHHLWKPSDNRTRDEWLACRGLPADSCERVPGKMQRLIDIVYGTNERAKNGGDKAISNTPDGCILLTEERIDEMIREAEHEKNVHGGRKRRQLSNFTASPDLLWTRQIAYKFDGSHNVTQQNIIRSAFQLWANNTCLQFTEISTNTSYADHHILVVKNVSSSCLSYVGRVRYIPQPLFLGDDCLTQYGIPGIPVHEIGHALGLYHEQQRSDRDNHVLVNITNIQPSYYLIAYKKMATVNAVPYHFGSVMHYGVTSFNVDSSNDLKTMLALNPLYQLNMGQRMELSFDDAHAINIAYNCDIQMCSGSPAITCQRGGYRDPKNCAKCRCPDGFGGSYCERVADPANAVCGGRFNLIEGDNVTIQSPGYINPGYYGNFQECSWLITGPPDRELTLRFVNSFGLLYSVAGGCTWHWVEVKFKHNLGQEGPRFCGRSLPGVNVTSESSEMLVIFKSNFAWQYHESGFQAVIKAGGKLPTTVVTSTSTTTTTTTSTISTTTTASSQSASASGQSTSVALPSPTSVTITPTESNSAAPYSGAGSTVLHTLYLVLFCVVIMFQMLRSCRR